jgi:hypothetical protein
LRRPIKRLRAAQMGRHAGKENQVSGQTLIARRRALVHPAPDQAIGREA